MMRKNYWNYKLKNMMVIFLSAAVSFSSAAGMSLKSYAADEQQENEEETNDSSENGDAGENNDAEKNENNDSNENNDNVESNGSSETNENNENNENTEENNNKENETNESDESNDINNNEETNNEEAASEEETETPESSASAPVEPTKPEIEGELDNDKIRQYNQEAENYNQQVDDYNKAVDEEYEQAVIDTERRNEEIEQNNQQQLARAAEVESENEQLQAQYEEELTQYNKDRAIEEKILKKGYSSVEQYNATINYYYNDPANTSVEKNADENAVFAIADSYAVEEATEKSGNTVKIHVEHNFAEIGLYYSENFEIDENDVITFYSAGAQLETTQPGYACFYMNTDDDHSMGYWVSDGSMFLNNAVTASDGWKNGDSHTLTYKDGKNHVGDITDIDMIYDYAWIPLNVYPTYNTPVEPTLNLIDFTPNIIEKLASPSKKSYLDHISLMDLLAEPEIEVIPEPEPEVIPEITPVVPVVPEIPVAPAAPIDETPADVTPDTTDDSTTPAADVTAPAPAPAAITIEEAPAPLAAVPEQGAVLGASRDTDEAAVLGARRASTEDTTNAPVRVMVLLLAGLTAITVIRKSGKRTLLK